MSDQKVKKLQFMGRLVKTVNGAEPDTAGNVTVDNLASQYYTDPSYFDITDEGVISLKPEYRGSCPSSRSEFTFAISDNGLGNIGSKNAELPKYLVVPEIVNEIAVVSLADGMFYNNKVIEHIVLPDGVVDIPLRCFDMAFGLRQIDNTGNIRNIAQAAFQGTHLEKAKFPNLQTMGTYAFTNCAFLVYADIGFVTSIPECAFRGCMMLSRIKGGESVTTVDADAFYSNYRLNKVDFLPNLTSIGNSAFQRCRLDYDWTSLDGCTFGEKATSLQLNPVDIWTDCTVKAAENPVPTLLSQVDPRWAKRTIGNSGITYDQGCVLFTAVHIYCALHGLTLSTVGELEEVISSDILDKFSDYRGNIIELLKALGLTVEKYTENTRESLQAIYDAFDDGKYAVVIYATKFGDNVSHSVMAYGVNSKKELLVADSAFNGYMLGEGEKTIKYSIPYQNAVISTTKICVVSL